MTHTLRSKCDPRTQSDQAPFASAAAKIVAMRIFIASPDRLTTRVLADVLSARGVDSAFASSSAGLQVSLNDLRGVDGVVAWLSADPESQVGVMYEVGFAEGRGLPVLILCEEYR